MEIIILIGFWLGGIVIDVDGLIKGFGDCMFIEDFFFILLFGGIVGVIGFNGVGKMMLF